MRMQLVEDSIQRIFFKFAEVEIKNVAECCAPHPVRHGMLGGWGNQPVECHCAYKSAHRFRQLAVAQNAIKLQTLPELVADMDRPGLTMLFSGDTRRIQSD